MVKYYVNYAFKFFFPNHIPDIFETLHTIGYFLILTWIITNLANTGVFFQKGENVPEIHTLEINAYFEGISVQSFMAIGFVPTNLWAANHSSDFQYSATWKE